MNRDEIKKLAEKTLGPLQELFESEDAPKPVPASDAIRSYLNDKILPELKDQFLSELRRKNGFSPRLIGFMDDGSMGIIDVGKAMDVDWGGRGTKEATAAVHRIASILPGVRASVFCVEMWTLAKPLESHEEMPKDIADHPDRQEGVMFNLLHYDRATNSMMQLMVIVEVIKVLGHNLSPDAWKHTEFGETKIIDTNAEYARGTKGRFIYGGGNNAD